LDLHRGVVPSDDFFALGGDSLGAEALMTRLVDDLGVRADVAKTGLLTEAPTLREFAKRLRDPARVSRGALVTLNPDGSRPPLFFIAGGGGLGMVFYALARRLGPDQPSYALQNRALESRALPQWSVAAMARRYLADLRTVQPEGPYYLAGHSFGGLVALEMAHQLTARGHRVARLIILDSFPPDPDLHPPVARLPFTQRLRANVGLIRAGLRHTPGAADPWRFFVQSGEVGLRYRGRPWGGDTLVVVAESSLKSIRCQWAPFLTGQWRQVQVKGDHESMLTAPWVDEAALAVRDFLAPSQAHGATQARQPSAGGISSRR
jgi:thioesterase domain-containing protein